jgi:hypothetical protein
MRVKQVLIDQIVALMVEFQPNVDYYQRPIKLKLKIFLHVRSSSYSHQGYAGNPDKG